MQARIFYSSQALGESVSSAQPHSVTREHLGALLQGLLQGDDDYLGIIDARERVIQFSRLGPDLYLADIPDTEGHRSLQSRLSLEAVLALLLALPADLRRLDPSGWERVDWG